MKNLLLSLFFCFPLILSAQSNSKIELLGSLNYSYRHHSNSGWIQTLRKYEKGKINTHFGVNYFQQLKPKIWLKIGIGFASLGYKTARQELTPGVGLAQDPLLQGIDNPTSQFIYNYHFLEVPFSLHVDFYENKLKPFVEIGIAPMYYLQSITKHKLGDKIRSKRNEEDDFLNDFQFAATVSFGFSYSINERWEMVLQPNFRYHLSKIADAPVKEHLWSTGLAVGMRMKLK